MRWTVEHVEGPAQVLHDLAVPAECLVRVNDVSAPALVLGSRQRRSTLVAVPPGGVDIVTRRSGGAAVWLAPGEQLWVDVVVPAGDRLHSDDVRLAAHRVGDAWSAALGSRAGTWRSGMTDPAASAIACFAGVGPGEVLLDDRKLVGISQRRTRDRSRFQCVAYHRWVPDEMLRFLDHAAAMIVDAPLRASVAVLGDLGAPEVHDQELPAWTDSLLERLVAQLESGPGT